MLDFIIWYFTVEYLIVAKNIFKSMVSGHLTLKIYHYIVETCSPKLYINKNSSKFNLKTNVILSNHRSFTDFFLDGMILGSNGCYISRMLVMVAIPWSSLWGVCSGTTRFFNRAPGSRNKLKNIIKNISDSGRNCILYPEGTRLKTLDPVPLKRGGLVSIYELGYTVQIMNITNKEKVIDEKNFIICRGTPCQIYIGPVVDSNKFTNVDHFIQHIENEWVRIWRENYLTDESEYSSKSVEYTWEHFVDKSSIQSGSGLKVDISIKNSTRIILMICMVGAICISLI